MENLKRCYCPASLCGYDTSPLPSGKITQEAFESLLPDHHQWILAEKARRAGLPAVASGKRIRFVGKNFRFLNFNGFNLWGASFRGCTFKYMDLRNVDFTGADLYYTTYYLSDIRGANFSRADLQYTSFCGANIDGAKIAKRDVGGPGHIIYALTDAEAEVIIEMRKKNVEAF